MTVDKMQQILFTRTGVLRSGWRAAAFLFAFLLTALAVGGVTRAAINVLGIEARTNSGLFLTLTGVLSLGLAILFGWWCGKFFEQLPFRALGAWFTERWFSHWLMGLVLGAVTLLIAVIAGVIFGGLRFEIGELSADTLLSLMISFIVYGVASAFEEALFRGYILQTLARSNLAWLAILLTSVFFGAVHAGNPAASVLSTINTILAGIWFSFAYLKTRDLWFVWGIHLMWNWMQGSIFGIEVSGLKNIGGNASLLREMDAGPTWLTGESYGIEGGIACTIAILISMVVIHFVRIPPNEELRKLTGPNYPSQFVS